MLIGYARLSMDEDSLAPQLDALRAAGCDVICKEKKPHGRRRRNKLPGLAQALAHCEDGDTLVVCKLCRLGGSVADLAQLVGGLRGRGAGLCVLTGAGAVIDMTGPEVPGILAAVVEFNHERQSERGRGAQKAQQRRAARNLGSGRKLTPHEVARAREWVEDGTLTMIAAAARLGVPRSTLQERVKKQSGSAKITPGKGNR
jgi:DNA invertase Pin-like site-specific DNA recombinase